MFWSFIYKVLWDSFSYLEGRPSLKKEKKRKEKHQDAVFYKDSRNKNHLSPGYPKASFYWSHTLSTHYKGMKWMGELFVNGNTTQGFNSKKRRQKCWSRIISVTLLFGFLILRMMSCISKYAILQRWEYC